MRGLTVSAPVILAISAIGLFRLRSTAWFSTYMASIRDYSAGATRLGVTNHGVLNFGFSNLRALFFALSHSTHYAVVGNYATLVLLAVLFTWSVLSRSTSEMSLDAHILALSIVGCLTLFQSSLQYYNYVFLLGVGVFALRDHAKGVRLCLMVALGSFIVPPGLLLSLSRRSRDPLDAALQLAHSGESGLAHLTRGQELLVCVPSLIFLVITLSLVAVFQRKSNRLAVSL
jgi:hypothetical protein